tara:strand:+ start:131 stop:2275 length:2145 start_codon:yes stop_codon:yes gene_type:complete
MANEVNIKITANDLASGKISKLRKGISGVNSTIENNRRGMLAAGAASVAFGTLAVRAAADFDKGMREVNTLINFSNRELDLLGYQVRELAKDFGINAVDATKALYSAISAGQEPAEAIEFLGVAAKTSIGGVTDLETAVDGLTSIVNAFGYESSETQDVADIMFETMRRGKTTIGELSDFFFQAAPVSSALGVTFEELSASITTLTLSGTPTRVAMTQVRQAMVALAKPTADMEALFEAVGFESGLAAIRSEGLVGALTKLQEESGATEEEFIKAVGSIDALQAVMGLTGKNTPAFLDNMVAMENAAGNVERAYATMADSTSQKFAEMTAAMQDAKIEIGENLAPAMEEAAKAATIASEAVGNAPTGLTTAILGVGATVGVIAVLQVAVSKLTVAFNLLKIPVLAVTGALGTGLAAMLGLVVVGTASLIKVSNDAINMAKEHKDELDGVTFAMTDSLDAYTKLQSAFNRREVWIDMNKAVSDLETQFGNFENVVGYVAEFSIKHFEDIADSIDDTLTDSYLSLDATVAEVNERMMRGDAFRTNNFLKQRGLEKEAIASVVKAEKDAISEKEKVRREEYDAGVARLNQRLSDDLNDAAIRLQQQQNIKNQDLAAFESLRASVSALPSVMSSSLGIGANLSDSGTAFAMRVLKSKGADAGFNSQGMMSAKGITGKEVIVNMNVYGNVMGKDTEEIVVDAITAGAQRGAYIESGAGI